MRRIQVKKYSNKSTKYAPRSLRDGELPKIKGGDGLAGNPATPPTDGGLAQMEQMMN
jgi:hypothetical protein